jgi:hypothetical protein
MAEAPAPTTEIRTQLPSGTKIEEVRSKFEMMIELAELDGIEFIGNHRFADRPLVVAPSIISDC